MRSAMTSTCIWERPAHDVVAGLVVAVHVEGGVLVAHPAQRGVELVLVGRLRAVTAKLMSGGGQAIGGEGDRRLTGHEHVAGGHLLQLGHRADVPGADLLQRDVVLALEREELSQPLLRSRCARRWRGCRWAARPRRRAAG